VEEVESDWEEDSHGATDEKARELYEIRCLTQDEVEEGEQVLHLPQEGTHRYRLPKYKEQEERQNEETPAGKVRPESAARGKLHDEVSSPTTTWYETKTEKVRTPLPQTTLRLVFRSKDFSGWMMNREYFLKYSRTYGPFDLDGASDNDGLISQVAEDFAVWRAHFKREIYKSKARDQPSMHRR
jgi:hypothetical protein